ncbi:MAG: hypothetical protein AAFN93_10420 [Bacteroidota bacterium]
MRKALLLFVFTLLGITQFLLIYRDWKEPWLIFPITVLWSLLLVFAFTPGKSPKKADFVIYDRKKQMIYKSMAIIIAVVLLIIFSFTQSNFDWVRSFLNLMNAGFAVLFSFATNTYFLFDKVGVTKGNNELKYEAVTRVRVTETEVAFDTSKYINDIVIKRHLVSDDLLDYIKGLGLKIEAVSSDNSTAV